MKTKEKYVNQYKWVLKGKKKVTLYIARDGKEFKSQKGVLQHERELDNLDKWNAIKKVENVYGFANLGDTWYFPSTQEELEMCKKNTGFNSKYGKVELNDNPKGKDNDLKVRQWFTYYYEDGGDYEGKYYFYSLDYITEKINNLFKKLEKK